MAATYTLGTTSFAAPVAKHDSVVKLASTSGLVTGYRLFAEGELMQVVSLGVSNLVNVRRGVDGTNAQHHDPYVTVYTGQADWFYTVDPQGHPREDLLVSPWINVRNGSIWFAQGDGAPRDIEQRWWQKQAIGYGTGPLGVRTAVPDITSST